VARVGPAGGVRPVTAERVLVENETFTGLPEADLRYLRQRLGGRLQVRRDGWAVTRIVGHLVTPGGRVLRIVSGKSTAQNLLAWLAFVDPALRSVKVDPVDVKLTAAGDLVGLLVRLFLRELLEVIQRHGLHKNYRRETVRGATIRGPIDFPRLIADGHDLSRLCCAVWLRAPDTMLNRVLAAAIQRIGGDPVLRIHGGEWLAAARGIFSMVPTCGIETSLVHDVVLARTEAVYRAAYECARMLLRVGGLGDGAVHRGFAFLVDLERLFETAVQRAFEADPDLACERQAPVHYSRKFPGKRGRVTMRIDALCRSTVRPLVVDAKFKYGVGAANIQQVVTYCYLTGARHGALVLPGVASEDGEIQVSPDPSTGNPVLQIRVVHFETTMTDVAGWRQAAADLVRRATAP
jgi:hypothetical protein